MWTKTEKQKTKKGFRIFLGYVFKYKKDIIFIIVLNTFSAVINGSIPYIAGKLFDSITSSRIVVFTPEIQFPLWAVMLFFWAALQIFCRAIDWVNSQKQNVFMLNMEYGYIIEGMKKLLYLPLPFHKNNKLGDTVNRISQASNRLDSAMNFLFELLPDFLSVVFGLIFVFIINYIFGIILVAAIVIYSFILFGILAPTRKLRKEAFKKTNEAYGNFYDSIGNIKTVKQSSAESYEEKSFFKKLILGSKEMWKKIVLTNNRLDFSQRVIVLVIQILIFTISIYYIRGGKMTLGELFAVNGYSALIFGPFSRLGRWWNWLNDCFISLEKAEKIFGNKEEEYLPKGLIKMPDFKGNIEFENVSFQYKDSKHQKGNEVLKNVSFKINQGETVAIVGESGVGKTTIADLISGFYFPQKGKILIDGIPTDKISLQFLRKNIAVVSQDITIFNESIRYNIRYGSFGVDKREIIRAAKEAGAHEFISKFKKGYNQLVGERGIKLSGGQRQRVAIAQAILKKAKILVLDEPTSALDARTEKMVTESLEKLMEGRTTIIIAHRLSTVKKADKIIVLDKGRVVEIGKHKDLIKKKNGIYRKFYEVQKL